MGYQLGNFSLEKRKWREAEEIKRAKAAKKRAEAAKRRKEEEQKRKEEEGEAKAAAKAAAEKEAYEKELAFWRQYIELLKAGKAKDAKALLEKTKQPSETDEFTKFKKGLFGVKYTGDISSLNADALATLSLKK